MSDLLSSVTTLSPLTVSPSPVAQFETWLAEAEAEATCGFNARNVCLTTSTPSGLPSARMILLKAVSEHGFAFHTHAASRKARELTMNPHAALLFYWPHLGRSVRVEGRAEQVEPEQSDAFFLGRPRGGLLAAWASPQSNVVEEGEVRAKVEMLREAYEGKDIPRPDHYGGWRIIPEEFEFFQESMEDRLHDRVRYRLSSEGNWKIDRLAP